MCAGVKRIALPAAPTGVNLVEIHEYLVLKHDCKVDRFPVRDGDVAQARVRASLCQLPGDSLIAVTGDAYIQIRTGAPTESATVRT